MRGINIRFPTNDDTTTNAFFKLNQITKEALSSNLLFLFLTEKGERYYMPDFGTNLLKYVFEPADNITVEDIKEEIDQTVSEYMPNIKINDIVFSWIGEDGSIVETDGTHQLTIKISFTYSENFFSEPGEIEISF